MLDKKDKKCIYNYFRPMPKPHKALIIFGSVFFLISLLFLILCSDFTKVISHKFIFIPWIGMGVCISIACYYISLCLYIYFYRCKENELDIQYLKLMGRDNVLDLAKQKFDFSQGEEFRFPPVVFNSYADKEQVLLSTPFMTKQGKDGQYRSTHILSQAFFFGKDILYQFGFVCDIMGQFKCIVCDEIFYKDIQSIRVTTLEQEFDSKNSSTDLVHEKIILKTKFHNEIIIPYWSNDPQKESFLLLRHYIRKNH